MLGRENFFSTLLCSLSGDLLIKLAKERLTKKKLQFLLIFTCMGFHRIDENKKKQTQGLIHPFNKEKRVWTSRDNKLQGNE